LSAFLYWRNTSDFRTEDEVALENPFQLGMALKFGAFLLVIMLLSKFLSVYFGDIGAYFLAAASGIADVDPITLTMSRMATQGMGLNTAATAILIAVSVNSGFKGMVALAVGGQSIGLRVGGALIAAVLAGLVMM